MLQVNMIDKLLAKIIFNQLNQFKPYVKHPNFKRIVQYLVILEYIIIWEPSGTKKWPVNDYITFQKVLNSDNNGNKRDS